MDGSGAPAANATSQSLCAAPDERGGPPSSRPRLRSRLRLSTSHGRRVERRGPPPTRRSWLTAARYDPRARGHSRRPWPRACPRAVFVQSMKRPASAAVRRRRRGDQPSPASALLAAALWEPTRRKRHSSPGSAPGRAYRGPAEVPILLAYPVGSALLLRAAGAAPVVEYLGIQENPNHAGWAGHTKTWCPCERVLKGLTLQYDALHSAEPAFCVGSGVRHLGVGVGRLACMGWCSGRWR